MKSNQRKKPEDPKVAKSEINTLKYIIHGISEPISFETQSNLIDMSKLYENVRKHHLFSSISFESFIPIAKDVLIHHHFFPLFSSD